MCDACINAARDFERSLVTPAQQRGFETWKKVNVDDARETGYDEGRGAMEDEAQAEYKVIVEQHKKIREIAVLMKNRLVIAEDQVDALIGEIDELADRLDLDL